ncbi:MAG: N-acetyltransferase [Terriglobia bacterium]|nr:MAG: N-acetyltransferase [Terriglobia bacterium]
MRPATAEDIEVILDHRIEMYRDMGYRDPEQLARVRGVSREYFNDALRNGGYHAILAEIEDAGIVGGGGVVVCPWPGSVDRLQPRRPWILNVYVRPGYRRRGVARAIMQELIAWCRAEGFDCVCLHASDEGRPLYEQLGFQPTNEMRLNLLG